MVILIRSSGVIDRSSLFGGREKKERKEREKKERKGKEKQVYLVWALA